MSAARTQTPSVDALARQASLFAALGDATRLKLVALLCTGSAMSTAQLTSATDLTRQAVTKHLQVLAEAGLVRDSRAGRERLWRFEAARLAEAQRTLAAIARQWDDALLRLQRYVENESP